ncbi:MAG TPA: hypothetical protein VK149_12305 [Sideroxyarcus sp.]|nr:hypothetical protein [Sideroxyarcus sp.]
MSDDVELNGAESSPEFDAGFSGTPTVTPEKTEAAGTEQQEQSQQQEHSQEQQQEPPKYRQITEEEFTRLNASAAAVDEMRATLGKQTDTIFGKIGGLERVLKQFQEQTPAGQSVEITEDDLAELKAEFPELVGPQLAAMQRIAGKMRGTGSAALDEGKLSQAVAPIVEKAGTDFVARAKLEIAEETLNETHPGWEQVVGTPPEPGKLPDNEYHRWLKTQPEDYRNRVLNSYSPVVIGKSIDKFNEHQASLKKANERRDRFEAAVDARGDGGHEPPADGDDAFIAGFNGG